MAISKKILEIWHFGTSFSLKSVWVTFIWVTLEFFLWPSGKNSPKKYTYTISFKSTHKYQRVCGIGLWLGVKKGSKKKHMWLMRFLEWEPLNCFEEFSSVFFPFWFWVLYKSICIFQLRYTVSFAPAQQQHRWKRKRNHNAKQTQKILAYLLTTPGWLWIKHLISCCNPLEPLQLP
jgi:hypothetical protein